MAKDEHFSILILFTLLLDIASSLYLSKEFAIKNVDETFIVICKDEGGLSVVWKGPKGRLGTRTHPKVQIGSYGTSIIFNKTRIDDSGNYTCSSSGSSKSRIFRLIVEENLKFKDTSPVQSAEEGKPATLRCDVNLNNVDITWSFADHEPLDPKYKVGGDGLIFQNVTREDANTYLCEVLHKPTGNRLGRNITLIVRHKPYPVYAQENVIYGFLNEIVNLTCEVEANPPPLIKWLDRGMGNIISESSHKSVLQLNMTENTPGKYKCEATNQLGKFEKLFNVEMGIEPESPLNITLIAAEPTSLKIEIEVPKNDSENSREVQMEPKWLVVGYRPVKEEDEEWTSQTFDIGSVILHLTDLEKKTKYEIRVATKNVAGLSEYLSETFETSLGTSVHMISPIFIILVNLTIFSISKFWTA